MVISTEVIKVSVIVKDDLMLLKALYRLKTTNEVLEKLLTGEIKR